MSELTLAVHGAQTAPFALVPTINFRLRVDDPSGEPIQSIQLRTQVRVEPERRAYTAAEHDHLLGLFGEPRRWGETLQSFLWTHVTAPVPGFTGSTEVDLPVECSYDLEVIAGQYFHALRTGEVPLLFLFSGTVFRRSTAGTSVEQIPWDRESRFAMPVATWRSTMDAAFPASGWLRLHRDTIDRLADVKARHALPSWDAVVDRLLGGSVLDDTEVDA